MKTRFHSRTRDASQVSGLVLLRFKGSTLRPSRRSITLQRLNVTNIDAYTKEYAPIAQAFDQKPRGGRLASRAGQNVTSVEGAPPTKRRGHPGLGEHGKDPSLAQFGGVQEKRARLATKYAKFRAFTVEGLPAIAGAALQTWKGGPPTLGGPPFCCASHELVGLDRLGCPTLHFAAPASRRRRWEGRVHF